MNKNTETKKAKVVKTPLKKAISDETNRFQRADFEFRNLMIANSLKKHADLNSVIVDVAELDKLSKSVDEAIKKNLEIKVTEKSCRTAILINVEIQIENDEVAGISRDSSAYSDTQKHFKSEMKKYAKVLFDKMSKDKRFKSAIMNKKDLFYDTDKKEVRCKVHNKTKAMDSYWRTLKS